MKKLFMSLCLFLAISSVYAQNFVPDPNKVYNIVESASSNVVGASGTQPSLTTNVNLASQAFHFVSVEGMTDTYYILNGANMYLNKKGGSNWESIYEAATNTTNSEWVIEGADATTGIRLKNNNNSLYLSSDNTGPGSSLYTDKSATHANGLYKLQEATIVAPDPTLYSENFEADFAPSGNVQTFAPTTKAGTWIGGKDLVTDLDANISLRGDNGGWASHGYTLQMAPTSSATPSAAVTISDIAITGYDNLKLSYEDCWLYWTPGENAFGANPDSEKSPGIEIKSGTGAWIPLTTAVVGSWTTHTLTLPAVDNTLPLSIRISGTMLYTMIINDLVLTGKAVTITNSNLLSDNSFMVYPNPATNYILTPNAQKVTITDLNGRIVKEAFNSEKVDVSSLANGAYIVKVNIKGSTKIGKLIKK